jgi:hypothetical protein
MTTDLGRITTMARRVKVPAAAIGAAVFVGLGALGSTLTDNAAAASVPETAGMTSIQSTPPSEPAIPVAVPTQMEPRFGGWCGGCAGN